MTCPVHVSPVHSVVMVHVLVSLGVGVASPLTVRLPLSVVAVYFPLSGVAGAVGFVDVDVGEVDDPAVVELVASGAGFDEHAAAPNPASATAITMGASERILLSVEALQMSSASIAAARAAPSVSTGRNPADADSWSTMACANRSGSPASA